MPGGLALLSTIIPTALAAMGAPENLLKFNREKYYYPLSTKLYLSDQLVWLVRAFLYQGSMTLEPYSCKNIPKSFNATGLKLLLGEVQVNIGEGPVDQCFPPIVIVKVNPTMKLMQRVFWTYNAIMKFSSDEEAVRHANCSRDVLGCAVFLGSQCRAKHTASQIHSGVAAVNDFASSYMFQSLPFGIFTGMEELRARCLVKSVVVDRWWPCIKPRYLSLFGNLLLGTDKVPRLSCGGSLLFEHLASIMGIDE